MLQFAKQILVPINKSIDNLSDSGLGASVPKSFHFEIRGNLGMEFLFWNTCKSAGRGVTPRASRAHTRS
jgi:hypothetical protein